jgi:hypothetical protein
LQLVSWLFVAFAASADSAPERYCPCPFQATAWTFILWSPEIVLFAGIGGALAAKRFSDYIITSAILAAIAILLPGRLSLSRGCAPGVVASATASDVTVGRKPSCVLGLCA